MSRPTLCRLEYLTPTGWAHGHAGVNLMDPQGYVDRLLTRKKFGRATELGTDLQPTGTVWEPPTLPALASLVPRTDGGAVPYGLPTDDSCPWCETQHPQPRDGTCLI